MIKKHFIVIIHFLFVLTLVACTSSKNKTLKLSTWGSAKEMAILKPLLEEFKQENPEIKLELLHIPDRYFQKLHTLIAANLIPDVVFTNNINFPLYASNNTFLDLEPFLAQSQKLKRADFFEQSLNAFKWQDKIQALPRDVSNMMIYYNQDLFDKFEIPYPTPDWTIDDFLAISKKLTMDTDNDGKVDQFGTSFNKYFLFWLPYLWSHGGDFFDKTHKKFTLTQPAAIKGLQFRADLRHKYHVAPTSSQAGNASMTQLFMQGKIAMLLNGRWAVPGFRESLKFKWDIMTFPHGSAGSIVDADGSGWAISRKTTQPQAAWRLVEFLAGKKASRAFTRPGLIIPARKDVAFSDVFLSPDKSPTNARLFLTSLDTAKPTPTVPYWSEVIDTINLALEPVWEGRQGAEEAMKGIQKKVEQLL